jgi:hypothetical protein
MKVRSPLFITLRLSPSMILVIIFPIRFSFLRPICGQFGYNCLHNTSINTPKSLIASTFSSAAAAAGRLYYQINELNGPQMAAKGYKFAFNRV